MRLTVFERESIRDSIHLLDPAAKIYLFGSRADDSKRGGDIDLLVFSSILTEKDRRKIKLKLYDLLGEQKIDLLMAQDTSDPFVRIALETSVPL